MYIYIHRYGLLCCVIILLLVLVLDDTLDKYREEGQVLGVQAYPAARWARRRVGQGTPVRSGQNQRAGGPRGTAILSTDISQISVLRAGFPGELPLPWGISPLEMRS